VRAHPTVQAEAVQPCSRALLGILGLATVALGAWGALQWSLIPIGFGGRVESVDYSSETGYQLRILKLTDGRSWVIDEAIVEELGGPPEMVGERAHKSTGDRTLTVGTERVNLSVSHDAWKVATVLSGFVVVAFLRNRSKRSAGTGA